MSIQKYLDFKTFNFLRTQFQSTVSKLASEKLTGSIYSHALMAPASVAAQRSFQLKGYNLPLFAYWSTSPPELDQQFYGKSVIPRSIKRADGTWMQARFMDLTYSCSIFQASYYKSTISALDWNMVEFDAARYIDLDFSEIIPGYISRVEYKILSKTYSEQPIARTQNRIFGETVNIKFLGTVPVSSDPYTIDRITLYLDSNKIWVRDLVAEVNNG